jgi:hypothetical protein
MRGIRTLLVETGHIRPQRLFNLPQRRAVWISVTANAREPLVEAIQDSTAFRKLYDVHRWASNSLQLGHIGWLDLRSQIKHESPAEKSVVDSVREYLKHKVDNARSTDADALLAH